MWPLEQQAEKELLQTIKVARLRLHFIMNEQQKMTGVISSPGPVVMASGGGLRSPPVAPCTLDTWASITGGGRLELAAALASLIDRVGLKLRNLRISTQKDRHNNNDEFG